MQIDGAVALVTGANRGLGQRISEQLVSRGAKVYGAARRPGSVTTPGVIPVHVDVTDADSVAAAAAATGDVTLLVNNAGMASSATLLTGPMDEVRATMESHFFGTLSVTRAFAPQLIANAPGAVLNVVSVLSWLHPQVLGAYAAAKTALWAQSDAIREEFAPHGVAVTALHIGFMDTDMIADLDTVKTDPGIIAAMAVDGVERGVIEVLTDEMTREAKAALSRERIAGAENTFEAWL
ncbi:SDR family oxidoreductase [Mycobacterium yunnanensis]|uniref:SDR family oxidoreductase n=1 Tax=Mycobacterium yunnanensis TaxID=368477 RepID=A0A9X2YJP7_9MYCO|nr:SDR family oxidoreductase [Mycobacterium yunnanensis]MCV7420537.1 SDR family oxidoreductase [Mycobacterium yunnanensis]